MKNKIKAEVKKTYGKIAISGSNTCCIPGECGCSASDGAKAVGYDSKDLETIPEASIIGAGCGAPLKSVEVKEGETVVDLGSGAGIDVFLSANRVGKSGKVIGIDMTEEMIEKARKNARDHGYENNVEFRQGDIEERIPVDSDSTDLVISNCVINLTIDKARAFHEVHRILKKGGRMVISDLVTDREIATDSVDAGKWCSCIDGAQTKENYLQNIRNAGFENIQVVKEHPYVEGDSVDGRRISSLVIKAVK